MNISQHNAKSALPNSIGKTLSMIATPLFWGSFCLTLLGLVSCTTHEGSEKQLRQEVDSFATYYYNWHFQEAAKFCTPESEIWMRYAASNVHGADIDLLHAKQEDAVVEIQDIKYQDDTDSATISISVSNFLQMDTIGKAARIIEQATFLIPAKLQENKWKVMLTQLPAQPK